MHKGLLYPLSVLLMLAGFGNAADADCDYRAFLEVGKSYYVYNPDYPNASTGQKSCRWIAQSDYRVKLTCGIFELPKTSQCSDVVVSVKISNSTTQRYCGNGLFSVESKGNQMTILYESKRYAGSSKFLCLLQAIDEESESDTCRCGWKKPTRIVGGSETGVNEYTMMAGLVDSTMRLLYCGATIISERYVLTAAHCLINKAPETLGVVVGEHNTREGSETNATRLLRVERYIMHPKYEPPKIADDIGIVVVQGRIEYSQEVGPACLPFQHRRDSFAGDYVEILGWGTTDYAGAKSDVLLKARVSVITEAKCERFYDDVTSAQLCTLTPGHDACQFDSGGPVLWQNPSTTQLVHVGVISFGGICGSDEPGVNTRVGDYLDWITFNTPDAAYCTNE